MTYDGFGNPKQWFKHGTEESETKYALNWSHVNRLTEITDRDTGEKYEYTYNHNGIRTSKKVGNTEHKYYLDGSRIIAETRTTGSKVDKFEYYYDTMGIVGFRYNGNDYYYTKNIQGDIERIYNSTGSTYAVYEYDAWGNRKITYDPNGIAGINPFGYRGYYLDNETKLWYLNSRYYDPFVGRFLSPDGLDYLDPESLGGLNLYAYCNNNPVMYYDPSGTLAILAILTIIGAVIGAIVGGLIAGFTAVNIFGTDNMGAIICSALLGVIFGAAVGALTGLIAGSFGPAVGGMAASGTTAALIGTKIGAWALSGVAVASGVAVTVGGAKLIGNVNFSQWEPGSWPGDDPTVSPGDGFEWRGPGEVGSEFGEWYNPETKDQLHPNLNHPLPKGPHWGWRNKLRRILKDIFKV